MESGIWGSLYGNGQIRTLKLDPEWSGGNEVGFS